VTHLERCPVCGGRGNLPPGFYNVNNEFAQTSCVPVECRGCVGKGYIFVEDHIPDQGCKDFGRPAHWNGKCSAHCAVYKRCCDREEVLKGDTQ